MLIVKELKELIKKKGGKCPVSNDIQDCLDALCACGDHSDWNAAEGEPGHVLNRPFYTETGEIISVEYNAESGPTLLENFPLFAVGDTVTVKVDGVEYSLVAGEEMGTPIVGDTYEEVQSGSGQYGWIIAYNDDANQAAFASMAAHTVSWNAPIIHKLAKKYLPSEVITSKYANKAIPVLTLYRGIGLLGDVAYFESTDGLTKDFEISPEEWDAAWDVAVAASNEEILLVDGSALVDANLFTSGDNPEIGLGKIWANTGTIDSFTTKLLYNKDTNIVTVTYSYEHVSLMTK